jgi:hypothetical protein
MIKAKIVTGDSAKELEAAINGWLRKTNPHVLNIKYHADGSEFVYSALILYV